MLNDSYTIKFDCPRCSRELGVSAELGGEKVKCGYCNNITVVPYPAEQDKVKQCQFCRETILKGAKKCKHCGEFIEGQAIRELPFVRLFTNIFAKRNIGSEQLLRIPINKIEANPFQPREVVSKASLADLKRSVSQYGVIVPIIVTKTKDGYQLVAGQRRFLAAKELGQKFIPAIVRRLSVREMMEVGYLENLHRENLNKLDRVQMFERVCNEYPEIGRERLAAMMGLSLAELDKIKEVLKLPVILQEALRAEMLTERHAFILKEIGDKKQLLKAIEEVYKNRLSIADTEEYVNHALKKNPKYVSSEQATHFHVPTCPYVAMIPEEERQRFYSRREALQMKKMACLQCL